MWQKRLRIRKKSGKNINTLKKKIKIKRTCEKRMISDLMAFSDKKMASIKARF